MFERFSSEARAVVVGAERYANELGDHHVQTHHLLLGTLDQTGTIAVRTLVERGVDIDAVRRELVVPAGPSDATSPTSLPFAPEAKKALELSLREALNLGDNRITCEHLLLALLQQPDTTAAQALTRSGSDRDLTSSRSYAPRFRQVPFVECQFQSTYSEIIPIVLSHVSTN